MISLDAGCSLSELDGNLTLKEQHRKKQFCQMRKEWLWILFSFDKTVSIYSGLALAKVLLNTAVHSGSAVKKNLTGPV